MKAFYDKNIMRKSFEPSHKVFLYNSSIHLFPRKLKSRWSGRYIVKTVFPHGAIEIGNPNNDSAFKVNGQRLKPFFDNFFPEVDTTSLKEPVHLD